ncbi:hypothetical protein niasHT_020412 [Heterodera trifolii]|uniref:DNA-directed DNA polymerase n=1 Tax=Heterodera trifolii TaxID=157864 RepID=A0ABD2JXB1_9BILA
MAYQQQQQRPGFQPREQLILYYANDVAILRESVIRFRQLITDNTQGLDPFLHASTAAGLALATFRRCFLPADRLVHSPEGGYLRGRRASAESQRYIRFFELEHPEAQVQCASWSVGEAHIEDSGYRVDGLWRREAPLRPLAIEWLGCYYHAAVGGGANSGSLYERTERRLFELEHDQGCEIHKVWACQWTERLRHDPDLKRGYDAVFVPFPLDPRNDALRGGRTEPFKLHHVCSDDEEIVCIDIVSLYPYVILAAKFNLCLVLERGHFNYIGRVEQLFDVPNYCIDCERRADARYHAFGCKVVCRLCLRYGPGYPCHREQLPNGGSSTRQCAGCQFIFPNDDCYNYHLANYAPAPMDRRGQRQRQLICQWRRVCRACGCIAYEGKHQCPREQAADDDGNCRRCNGPHTVEEPCYIQPLDDGSVRQRASIAVDNDDSDDNDDEDEDLPLRLCFFDAETSQDRPLQLNNRTAKKHVPLLIVAEVICERCLLTGISVNDGFGRRAPGCLCMSGMRETTVLRQLQHQPSTSAASSSTPLTTKAPTPWTNFKLPNGGSSTRQCAGCQFIFPNDDCYNYHLANYAPAPMDRRGQRQRQPICQWRRVCRACGCIAYEGKHQCPREQAADDDGNCRRCNGPHTVEEPCYIQPLDDGSVRQRASIAVDNDDSDDNDDDDEDLPLRLCFFDAETSQDRPLQLNNRTAKKHVPLLIVAEVICERCLLAGISVNDGFGRRAPGCLCMSGMVRGQQLRQWSSPPFVNAAGDNSPAPVAAPAFNQRRFFFHSFDNEGPDPVDQFLDFLLHHGPKKAHTVCIAHNGGKYDFHLVLEALHRRNRPPKQLYTTGLKIYSMRLSGRNQRRITFKDSINYFFCALDTLVKSFEVPDHLAKVKPFFPYLYIRRQHLSQRLNGLPAREFYSPTR